MGPFAALANTEKRLIRLGHSPDADDAFMFCAIAKGKIDTGPFLFEHVIEDIERLNSRATAGELEVTAISFHAYAYVSDRYAILSAGSSLGFGYGPVVVARRRQLGASLAGKRIAVPGIMTTAFLLLKLYEPCFSYEVVPFDQILNHVAEGKAEAGLLIHEGQLTYGRHRLQKIVDLGEWWDGKTGLPLPLGADCVRKDLPQAVQKQLAAILRRSIEWALQNRPQALEYASRFSRGLEAGLTDEFVGMYVNESTLALDEKAKTAIRTLLDWGHRARLLPRSVKPEFVEP